MGNPPEAFAAQIVSGLIWQPDAFGQTSDYRSRPVKIIVSYPPGGTTDLVARVVGQKLAEGGYGPAPASAREA